MRDMGLRWNDPAGAFYVFLAVDSLIPAAITKNTGTRKIANSVALAEYLLEEWNLATVPGLGFGREGYLRLSFANSTEVLKEAFDRLEQGLRALAQA
jgi:aspartate aminotransferase